MVSRRRDIDGDMDSLYLTSDMILNCSKKYVPELKRGALMSVPLTMSTEYPVNQVGKEILSRQLVSDYYGGLINDNTREHTLPELKKIPSFADFLDKKIGVSDMKFNTFSFSLDLGTYENYYKDSESTLEKLDRTIELQNKLKNVKLTDGFIGLIEGHLLPDIQGNYNAYFRQDYKCNFCARKYQFIPLTLKCRACKIGVLKHTVYPGMVVKYVPILKKILETGKFPTVVTQSCDLILQQVKVFLAQQESGNPIFEDFI